MSGISPRPRPPGPLTVFLMRIRTAPRISASSFLEPYETPCRDADADAGLDVDLNLNGRRMYELLDVVREISATATAEAQFPIATAQLRALAPITNSYQAGAALRLTDELLLRLAKKWPAPEPEWCFQSAVRALRAWRDRPLMECADYVASAVVCAMGTLPTAARKTVLANTIAAIIRALEVTTPPTMPPLPTPLDDHADGERLRGLLMADELNRREAPRPEPFTPAQRAAVSAHWSAELRAKVDASRKADAERNQVLVDLQVDIDD